MEQQTRLTRLTEDHASGAWFLVGPKCSQFGHNDDDDDIQKSMVWQWLVVVVVVSFRSS